MNISSVCLPLVSENKKLIWVPSQQIELHPNEAAELDKAFDRFPYLTNEQTAALAQRCSLHPDQVKVWFMAQRLRYGISWDYKDITEVCSKLKSSEGDTEGNEELKSTKGKKEHKQGKKKKQKEKNIRDNEQLKRKTVQEQPLQTEINRTVKEDKVSPEKKQNMITGIDERERKRMRPYNVEVIEGETKPEVKSDNSENEGQKCKLEDTFQKLIQELPAYMNTNVPSVPQVASNPFTEVDNPLLAGDQCTFARQNKNNGSDACCPSCISSNKVKTHAQLSIMKVGFIKCQYPDNDYYRQLALVTGLCRKKLVEWYSDTRYQVKKSKPRWMNEKQHRQALDNIKYRQRLTKLAQL
ncbi:homeobox and leucine zipper encoding b [Cololabis saira]|uniref:homeobox and leucine zipper encoding b n=1 Tax=Cololabis saira TaxID=129043 RepID=UPI002AD4B7B8|nr:homeobox and leucine zipper encoding b [Cololabis saira]